MQHYSGRVQWLGAHLPAARGTSRGHRFVRGQGLEYGRGPCAEISREYTSGVEEVSVQSDLCDLGRGTGVFEHSV